MRVAALYIKLTYRLQSSFTLTGHTICLQYFIWQVQHCLLLAFGAVFSMT